ncbi:hypothetical protein [Methylosinus sp. KRF6]|uniref:hypothetical protein n=1 Tax=Methylosinus sp. KRF6 TaxID=2846853 RepID=UPI001C0B9EEE|nr:hypothetical protein [Methylosinus sp. KRF6]MBU3889719.1 hypothetical protein [Methylosinus sp. KRF6]
MIDVAAARRALDERNRLRVEAGLPQLSAEGELQRLSETERRKAFDEFFESSPLRQRIEEKLLNRVRRVNNDPDWRPTGALSGGGWAFYLSARKRMRSIWLRRQRKS